MRPAPRLLSLDSRQFYPLGAVLGEQGAEPKSREFVVSLDTPGCPGRPRRGTAASYIPCRRRGRQHQGRSGSPAAPVTLGCARAAAGCTPLLDLLDQGAGLLLVRVTVSGEPLRELVVIHEVVSYHGEGKPAVGADVLPPCPERQLGSSSSGSAASPKRAYLLLSGRLPKIKGSAH